MPEVVGLKKFIYFIVYLYLSNYDDKNEIYLSFTFTTLKTLKAFWEIVELAVSVWPKQFNWLVKKQSNAT